MRPSLCQPSLWYCLPGLCNWTPPRPSGFRKAANWDCMGSSVLRCTQHKSAVTLLFRNPSAPAVEVPDRGTCRLEGTHFSRPTENERPWVLLFSSFFKRSLSLGWRSHSGTCGCAPRFKGVPNCLQGPQEKSLAARHPGPGVVCITSPKPWEHRASRSTAGLRSADLAPGSPKCSLPA